MERYSAITAAGDGPTVDELMEKLADLSRQGMGKNTVLIFDPNTQDWEPLTGLVYGEERPVKLYSEPE
jgi:hypothetical protein